MYLTLGGLLFQINLDTISLYWCITHVGLCIQEPRYRSCDINSVFATSTLPFRVSFLRDHCLARFSNMVILSLMFSSVYLFKSLPILTPNDITQSVHLIPQGLCLKFEDAAIQIASLLSLFKHTFLVVLSFNAPNCILNNTLMCIVDILLRNVCGIQLTFGL